MAFDTGGYSYGTKTVGTSATQVSDGAYRRKTLLIQNAHATNNLFVGPDSSVTTSTGIKLAPADSIEFSDFIKPVYAIADGASTDVRYLELG